MDNVNNLNKVNVSQINVKTSHGSWLIFKFSLKIIMKC